MLKYKNRLGIGSLVLSLDELLQLPDRVLQSICDFLARKPHLEAALVLLRPAARFPLFLDVLVETAFP
jgi:hypothetical protein